MPKLLCLICAMFCFSIAASQVHGKECASLNDMLASDGCVVSATRAFNQWGYVRVKARAGESNSSSFDTLLHVVGPYNPPLLQADFSEAIFSDLKPLQKKVGSTIIYYEFSEINDYSLQDKAYALIAAMKKIDALRGRTRPSVMMGLSLGGVVARYSLVSLEKEGYQHGVTHYVSFDSPHQGAHVPLGMQELFNFFPKAFNAAKKDNSDFAGKFLKLLGLFSNSGPIEDFEKGMKELRSANRLAAEAARMLKADSIAAKQLLIHSANANNHRSIEGQGLLAELNLMGLPKGGNLSISNIAVATGSVTGDKFSPTNDYYFDWTSPKIKDVRFVLKIPVMGKVKSRSYKNLVEILHDTDIFLGKFTYPDASSKLDPFDNGEDTYVYERVVSEKSSKWHPYDLMACSTVELPSLIVDTVKNNFYESDGTVSQFKQYFESFYAQELSSCFIPTASALAIPVENFRDVGTNLISQSPFDAVFGQSANLAHDVTMFKNCALRKDGQSNSVCFWDALNRYVDDSCIKNIFWAYDNVNKQKLTANTERLIPIFHILM